MFVKLIVYMMDTHTHTHTYTQHVTLTVGSGTLLHWQDPHTHSPCPEQTSDDLHVKREHYLSEREHKSSEREHYSSEQRTLLQ